MIDDDLKGVDFEWVPGLVNVKTEIPVELAVPYDYPAGPYIFRVVRQNGSRLRLRAVGMDGSWRRWPEGHELAGSFFERAAYTSDVRHQRAGWKRGL